MNKKSETNCLQAGLRPNGAPEIIFLYSEIYWENIVSIIQTYIYV